MGETVEKPAGLPAAGARNITEMPAAVGTPFLAPVPDHQIPQTPAAAIAPSPLPIPAPEDVFLADQATSEPFNYLDFLNEDLPPLPQLEPLFPAPQFPQFWIDVDQFQVPAPATDFPGWGIYPPPLLV